MSANCLQEQKEILGRYDKLMLEGQRECVVFQNTFWLVKFFGLDFHMDFRSAPHGFFLYERDKDVDQPKISEQLKHCLSTKVKSQLKVLQPESEEPAADLETPHLLVEKLTPLNEEIKAKYGLVSRELADEFAQDFTYAQEGFFTDQMDQNLLVSQANSRKFYKEGTQKNHNLISECTQNFFAKIEREHLAGYSSFNKSDCLGVYDLMKINPDNREKFWEQIRQEAQTEEVSLETLRNQVYRTLTENVNLKDHCLVVYEVKHKVPTIFLMQEVVHTFKESINCFEFAFWQTKQDYKELKQFMHKQDFKMLNKMLSTYRDPHAQTGVRPYFALYFNENLINFEEQEDERQLQLIALFKVLRDFVQLLEKGVQFMDQNRKKQQVQACFDPVTPMGNCLQKYKTGVKNLKDTCQKVLQDFKMEQRMEKNRDQLKGIDSEDSDSD